MTIRLLLVFIGAAASLSPAQTDPDARPRRVERSHDFDVLHYRIQLRFNEAERSFQGETGTRLRSLRDGFDTLVLDAETFRVTAAGSLRFEQEPGRLTVHHQRRACFPLVGARLDAGNQRVRIGTKSDFGQRTRAAVSAGGEGGLQAKVTDPDSNAVAERQFGSWRRKRLLRHDLPARQSPPLFWYG